LLCRRFDEGRVEALLVSGDEGGSLGIAIRIVTASISRLFATSPALVNLLRSSSSMILRLLSTMARFSSLAQIFGLPSVFIRYA
jgi:hypothetical protein